ncbi:putative ADP-ribosylation factor GTPase-activating protein AGD13 [Capsicum baccatum]|uniref:ADP-ribosylation factor GTPase-activating protein AGD13 n=1 Tax=Capsicum baccatum TaxID=33114 RepID=A0A2G2V819_CAPBA|nr:putative ADP-ribosylation factor GTPase-activating protein AGD13 [Capsicum baccatum]
MGNANIRLVNTNPDLFPLLNMTMMLQVLSVTLDEWSDDEIDAMVEVGGNASANSIYEAYIPEGISKPGPDASHEQRSKFISLHEPFRIDCCVSFLVKYWYVGLEMVCVCGFLNEDFLLFIFSPQLSFALYSSALSINGILDPFGYYHAMILMSKYERQEFLKPSLRILSNQKKGSLKTSLSSKITDSFRSSSSSSQKSEGMVEFIGMLKVKVIKGTNLAIRDMLSSDPYVVMYLGKQKVQTTIVKSNLNPVWNEELMLSVPQDYGAVKLVIILFYFSQTMFSNFLLLFLCPSC